MLNFAGWHPQQDRVAAGVQDVKEAATGFVERAKDAIHNVQDKLHAAKESLMDAQQRMADTASKSADQAQNIVPDLKDKAASTLGEKISDLKHSAQQAISGMSGSVQDKIQNAQDSIRGVPGSVRDRFADATAKLPDLPKSWDPRDWFRFGTSVLSTASIFGILARSLFITMGVQLAGFALHQVSGSVLHYDAFGSGNVALLALYTLFSQNSVFSVRQVVLTIMTCMWASRLGTYLTARTKKRGADPGLKPMQTPKERFAAWAMQSAWVMCVSLPVIFVNAESNADAKPHSITSLTFKDYLGFAIWCAGFAIESLADYQKSTFEDNQVKEKSEDKPFVHTGLWARSQHPNYFGEILMWTGIYLSSLSILHGFEHIAVLAPVFTFFILRYVTGVPRVRKINQDKYGQLPSYQSYIAKTPLIVPGLF